MTSVELTSAFWCLMALLAFAGVVYAGIRHKTADRDQVRPIRCPGCLSLLQDCGCEFEDPEIAEREQ